MRGGAAARRAEEAGGIRRALRGTLVLATLGIACCSSPAPGGADASNQSADAAASTSPAATEPNAEDQFPAQLYFPDAEGSLQVESRLIAREPTPALQARALVEALVAGPQGELTRALPADASVRALHLQPDGTVYLDMNQAFASGLSSGSEDALLAVRSIVQTLAGNVPEVHRVKFLVEGEESLALGGHLDLSRPISPEGRPE